MAGRIGYEPANDADAGWRPAMPDGSAGPSCEPTGRLARVPEDACRGGGEAAPGPCMPHATPVALEPSGRTASAAAPPASGGNPVVPPAEDVEMERGPVLDAGGYIPDEEALRGTRFEFGGRRPQSFVPRRPAFAASQRPLPGIGTVALGRVVRVAPYGAFVDFLGFRGLVHISQLRPGYRVERVEDVVQPGDEVVVRVIAIDPERRHINLALMPSSAAMTTAPRVATGTPRTMPAPASGVPAEPTSHQREGEGAPPSAAAPPIASAPSEPAAPSAVPARMATGMAPPAANDLAQRAARASQRAGAAAMVPPAAAPGAAHAAPAVHAPVGPARPGAAAPKPPARAARPRVAHAEAARHPSRAVHRETLEPAHPMARLLASAGPAALHPVDKDRLPESGDWPVPPVEPPAEQVAPEAASAVVEPFERPVHEAAPVPEPEAPGATTLEALVARFGPRREPPAASRRGGDRSRLEREKQAALLARLRGER
jgi:predicted RNA-binding protein with RPS1 domain